VTQTQARPGRRPGSDTTAQTILEHARAAFSKHGYAHTSLRAVADAAGVDAAMISYFFGSKRGLFQAAIEVPIRPDTPALVEFRTSDADAPERIARLFFTLWDTPAVADSLSAILLEAGLDSAAGQALRRFMFTYVGGPVIRELGADNPEIRLRMAVGFMAAIALQRRFDPACPLAALDREQVVALVTPTLRHIVTSPIPAGVACGAESDPLLAQLATDPSQPCARDVP
jgi:AcrR family transcriptional regulator